MRLRLSFQSANKADESVDLVFLQFVAEGRHVTAHVTSVHDRVEDTFVADVSLPICVSKIARVVVLAFRSFRLSIAAMTRDAIASIQLRCGTRVTGPGLGLGKQGEEDQYN